MCVHGTTGPEGQIEERRTAPQAEASRLEGMQRTGSQEELVHGPIEGSTVSLASDISVAADSTVMHRSDAASRESEATKLTKVSDVVRSLTDSIQTSLDTLAHDTHEKDDGLELMLDRARAILVSDVPIESVVSLFQAVDNYLATHQDRLFRQYKKDRLAVAKRLYDSLNQFLADKLAEKEKAKESEDGGSSTSSALSSMDIPSGIAKDQDELAKAKKGVKEFKKYYDSWREKLAGDVLRTPEEIIDAKLRLFEPYLDDLSKFKSLGETDKDFSFLYTEYRSLMMRKTMMQGKTSRNTKMEIAKEVAIQMDPELKDIEAGNKDMDQGVTEAQRAAVGQIDRWMIKNFNNGGMFGIKFDQSSFVSKILSLSVRERLYVYYLVETNKRKAPVIADLFESQDAGYIPSLDTFKGKMTATKFKLGSYFSGKYVYWHKLTEAMQHLGNNRLLLEERYASFDEKEEETDLREEYLGSLEQEEEKIAGSTASAEKKESKQLKTDKQSYEINLTKRLDKLVELQKLLVILEKEKKKSEEKKEDKDHKAQKDVAGQEKPLTASWRIR